MYDGLTPGRRFDMKRMLVILCGLLLAALSAAAQSQTSTDKSADKSADKATDKTSDKAQALVTADIMKVDAKKMVLQVRQVVDSGDRPSPNQNGGNGGAGGRRGGGRRTGGGYPGGGSRPSGGGGYPGSGPSVRTNQPKEYKVFVSKETVMKFADVPLDFSDLHVGDRISVTGTPKGSDLEATAITRK
jgi:hypothetical protein